MFRVIVFPILATIVAAIVLIDICASATYDSTRETRRTLPILAASPPPESPKLFGYRNHHRTPFDFGLASNGRVSLELITDQNAGEEFKVVEVDIECLSRASSAKEAKVTLSSENPRSELIATGGECVPFARVAFLDRIDVNATVVVEAKTSDAAYDLPFVRLSQDELLLRFPSKQLCDFHGQLASHSNPDGIFGFIDTPNAQVLVHTRDTLKMENCTILLHALIQLNDVIEFYDHMSGREKYRSRADTVQGSFTRVPEYRILFKGEDCDPEYLATLINQNLPVDTYEMLGMAHKKNDTLTKGCGASAISIEDRIVVINDDVSGILLPLDGTNWQLFHEIAHQYDLYEDLPLIQLQETYVNVYTASYQSQFKFEKDESYWMIDNDGLVVDACRNNYTNHNLKMLKTGDHLCIAHFLFGLLHVIPDFFRTYNVLTMNDTSTTEDGFFRSVVTVGRDSADIDLIPVVDFLMNQDDFGRIFLFGQSFMIEYYATLMQFNGTRTYRPCFQRKPRTDIRDATSAFSKQSVSFRLCGSTPVQNAVDVHGKDVGERYHTYDLFCEKCREYNINSLFVNDQQLVPLNEEGHSTVTSLDDILVVYSDATEVVVHPTYVYADDTSSWSLIVSNTSAIAVDAFVFKGFANLYARLTIARLRVGKPKLIRFEILEKDPHDRFPNETYLELTLRNVRGEENEVNIVIQGTNQTVHHKEYEMAADEGFEVIVKAAEPGKVFLNGVRLTELQSDVTSMTPVSFVEHADGHLVPSDKIYKRSLEKLSLTYDKLKERFKFIDIYKQKLDRLVNGDKNKKTDE